MAPGLMADPAIFGVGVTQSRDNPAEAALLVLVDIGRNPQSMPDDDGWAAGGVHAAASVPHDAVEVGDGRQGAGCWVQGTAGGGLESEGW